MTKKARHTLKETIVVFRIKYLYPSLPPFWEKIAYVSIFYKISSSEQKKNVICHANTDYN